MYISEDTKHAFGAFVFGLVAVIGVTSVLRYFAYQYEQRNPTGDVASISESIPEQPSVLADSAPQVTTSAAQMTRGRSVRVASVIRVEELPMRQADTYQIAVANYERSRLQFDNCVLAAPFAQAVYTSGADVLIEGKSPDPQVVRIGSRSVTLNGNELLLVTMPRVSVVTELSVDCQTQDSWQYNIGSIIVYP